MASMIAVGTFQSCQSHFKGLLWMVEPGIALKSPPPNKNQPEAITPVIAMRILGYARIVSKAMVEQME